jgi:excisionase family DNA binding protein
MQVSEAADYIGISAQTLRRWDRDGRLTAVRRPGSEYRYCLKADLEPFRLEYRRAQEAMGKNGEIFTTANANIEANDLLREPQKEAHRHVREHFTTSKEPAILQIPVGCGKTGIMATALIDQGPGYARPCGACPRYAAGRAALRDTHSTQPSRSRCPLLASAGSLRDTNEARLCRYETF